LASFYGCGGIIHRGSGFKKLPESSASVAVSPGNPRRRAYLPGSPQLAAGAIRRIAKGVTENDLDLTLVKKRLDYLKWTPFYRTKKNLIRMIFSLKFGISIKKN